MIVTDLQYALENRLITKLDLMIKRCEQTNPKKDAALICEGAEGEGKTNSSIAIAYYIKSKTGRDIHLFFELEKLIDFAQNNKNKIIIWDEPALDALSTDWYKATNINLMRLLMMARKNRHFFIWNFTKFYKFSEYIVVDRSLGLVHMYSRNETEPGRFVYIRKKDLEPLYLGYKISKKRLYKKYSSFRGRFTEVLEKNFSKMGIFVEEKANATYEDYEFVKDRAIKSIGKKKEPPKESFEEGQARKNLRLLRYAIASLTFPIKTKEEFAGLLTLTIRTLQKWKQFGGVSERPEALENSRALKFGKTMEEIKEEGKKIGIDVVNDLVESVEDSPSLESKDESVYPGIPQYTNPQQPTETADTSKEKVSKKKKSSKVTNLEELK